MGTQLKLYPIKPQKQLDSTPISYIIQLAHAVIQKINKGRETHLPFMGRCVCQLGPSCLGELTMNESLLLKYIGSLLEIDDDGLVWRTEIIVNGEVRQIQRCRDGIKNVGGYLVIKIGNITCMAHRLVYHHFYGEIPDGYIVHHKNRNKSDNRPKNLIALSKSDHAQYHNNKSYPFSRKWLRNSIKARKAAKKAGEYNSE